jgi:hypothetical protein
MLVYGFMETPELRGTLPRQRENIFSLQTDLKAMSHGAIFHATCNVTPHLRGPKRC